MGEVFGWAVAAVAVAGVVLNNRRVRACFCLWWASNAASAALHASAGMWALTARDLVFLALAVHGWILWARPKRRLEHTGETPVAPKDIRTDGNHATERQAADRPEAAV